MELEEMVSSINPNLLKSNLVTMANLKETIDRVRAQPSKINAACAFYINDLDDYRSAFSITSSCIAPNCQSVAFTTEHSTIQVFDLNENTKTVNQSNNVSVYIDHDLFFNLVREIV